MSAAICVVAGDAPVDLPTHWETSVHLDARAPVDGDPTLDRVRLVPDLEGTGNYATTAWCRGPILLVAHRGPVWTVASGAADLARELGAMLRPDAR